MGTVHELYLCICTEIDYFPGMVLHDIGEGCLRKNNQFHYEAKENFELCNFCN